MQDLSGAEHRPQILSAVTNINKYWIKREKMAC